MPTDTVTMSSDTVEAYRQVFAFACTGRLPDDLCQNQGTNLSQQGSDGEQRTELAKVQSYLAAAAKLKAMKLSTTHKDKSAEDEDGVPVEQESKKRKLDAADAELVRSACALIRQHRFGHEHIGDTRLLSCPDIWSTMLEGTMPMTALIRNLGRMSSMGLLDNSDQAARVVSQLSDPAAVAASRLHPITLLEAQTVYASGHGTLGSLTWVPNARVANALQSAFYMSFKNVESTGLQWLMGVDVSGSMGGAQACGMKSLTSRDAAAAILMALMRSEGESRVKTMAFGDGFVPLPIRSSMSLEQVKGIMERMPFGATDCAQPMLYATQHRIPVDVFVVMTDNETWSGGIHPTEALKTYRTVMKRPNAKLVVMAFAVTQFSIADPQDPSMIDIAGLDSAVPRIIREFAMGKL